VSERGGRLRTASWILVTFFTAVVALISGVSAWLAYSGADYPIAGEPVAEVAAGREGIEVGLRAIRGTSAAYALGFSILMIGIAVGPYRQGTRWSWWTLLVANLGLWAAVALRLPALGTSAGVGAATTQVVLIVVALLLDAGRLRSAEG
jgi:hypothetical protein